MDFLRRLFYRLYPTNQKYTDTTEGDTLRFRIGVCLFLHIGFFGVSLSLIGFRSMISELLFAMWAYSTFLTLREWQVIMYVIGLFFALVYGIFHLFTYPKYSLLFYIINVIFLGLAFYFVVLAYKNFRYTGGIHG